MTGDDDIGQKLRRLMTEAVEPVTPEPGQEARFLARLRASQKTGRRVPAPLRWSAAGLSTAAVVAVAVLFAARGHDAKSSAASAGSNAVSPSSVSASSAATERSPAAAEPGGPSRADLALPFRTNPQLNSDAGQGSAGGSFSASTGSVPKAALVPPDLDEDGVVDTFALERGTLVAQLSRVGRQTVTLPTLGAGAGVLGTTRLITAARTPVSVAFVRLSDMAGQTRDVVVAVADGRLTLLRFGSTSAVLTVDAMHGYACSDGELAVSGNSALYVINGAQLVASPRLRALLAVAGQASGC